MSIALVVAAALAADAAYFAKLTATEPNAEAQFRLAVWAERQGLKEEAAGHYKAAVHLDPEFVPAQKALGRSLKDVRWETKHERQQRLADQKKFEVDRKEW